MQVPAIHRCSRLVVVLAFAAGAMAVWLTLGMNRGLLLSCDDRAAMWPWRGVLEYRPPQAEVLADGDLQFVPWLRFARQELLAGRLPLWNPHQDAGEPLLGNGISALGTPLDWPPLLLGVKDGWNLSLLLRILVAAGGVFLWLRSLERSRTAAGLGAVMYALSGPFVAWLEHPQTLTAAAVPLLLYFITRYRRDESVGSALGVAGSTFLVLAGGHPETALMAALLALLATAMPPRPWRATVRTFPFAVAGALLAAPLLLPLVEYLRLSAAATGDRLPAFVLPLDALVRFVAPHARVGHPIEAAATVSLTGLLLAVGGAVPTWRSRERRWLIAALVMLLIAYDNPASRWLAGHTPVFQSRVMILLPLALAVMASAGLDRLTAWIQRRWRRWAVPLLALVPVVAFAELLGAAVGVHAVSPPWLLRASTPMLEMLRRDPEPFRVLPIGGFLHPNLATAEGLDDVRGYDALGPRGWRASRAAMGHFVDERLRFEGISSGGRALDVWNVRYILAPPNAGVSAERARRELGLDVVEVYRGPDGIALFNRRALPRVRLDGGGRVEVTARTPTDWRIRAAVSTAGRLIVANPYFPGWQVRVDGRRRALDLAPGDPIVVPLAAGEHRVEVLYRPLSFSLGLALAAVGAALLAAWAVVAHRRRGIAIFD